MLEKRIVCRVHAVFFGSMKTQPGRSPGKTGSYLRMEPIVYLKNRHGCLSVSLFGRDYFYSRFTITIQIIKEEWVLEWVLRLIIFFIQVWVQGRISPGAFPRGKRKKSPMESHFPVSAARALPVLHHPGCCCFLFRRAAQVGNLLKKLPQNPPTPLLLFPEKSQFREKCTQGMADWIPRITGGAVSRRLVSFVFFLLFYFLGEGFPQSWTLCLKGRSSTSNPCELPSQI